MEQYQRRFHNYLAYLFCKKLLQAFSSLFCRKISDNTLSGTMPNEFGYLTLLTVLYIGGNDIEGQIPDSFCDLTSLEDVYLSSEIILNH